MSRKFAKMKNAKKKRRIWKQLVFHRLEPKRLSKKTEVAQPPPATSPPHPGTNNYQNLWKPPKTWKKITIY